MAAIARDDLLELIDLAEAENREELDLSGMELRSLPAEIGKLTGLRKLVLGKVTDWNWVDGKLVPTLVTNQLTAWPEELQLLTHLRELDLSGNPLGHCPDWLGKFGLLEQLGLTSIGLSEIPDSIAALSNLTQLWLSSNQITSIPDSIAALTNLTDLWLDSNQITSIPDSIAALTNLMQLGLDSNQITSIPDSIAALTNLMQLGLSSNQITSIPDSIAALTNLTELWLSSNQITSIPDSIAALTNLTELWLSSNQITSIPDSIAALTNLTELWLHSNQITSIPDSIAVLTDLTKLGLHSNQITSIPNSIAALTNLTKLGLHSNQITSIPDSIAALTNLTKLWLHSNQITSIPDSIAALTNLTKLWLSRNQITSIPDSIAALTNLTELGLSSNQITSIPDSIAALTNLMKLWLHSNQITSIPDSIAALTNLTFLDLAKNQIIEIPACLASLPNLSQLDLRGNPLSVPKDVLDSDADSRGDNDRPAAKPILDYIAITRDPNEITHLYEAKLLIVGEGESGKTSLAHKLITPDSPLQPHPTTHGIDIRLWDYTDRDHNYRIHIWDFGGQEIYHATHQFFLTDRSLYLLVADSRKEDTDHPYWLNIIRLLSNNSPVLLVQNEKDDRTCNLNLRELRTEFDALSIPKPINLADDRGLPDLRKAIQRQLEDLLGPGIPFPNKWLNLRNSLENDKRNHITLHDYQATCRRHNITDEREMLTLSNHLHQLGTCLHFQHDPILKHTLILKPNWGTAAVYKVLDNDRVTQNLGQFSTADLSDIWSDRQYANLQHELLRLMSQFKVCYEIPHRSGHFIAPHLLSTDSPDYPNCWRSPTTIALRYEYEGIMPKGLLSRFIVEMHEDIENVSCPDQALVWRTGVVLSRANNRAEILETQIRNEIQIRVSGPQPRDLLTVIHHEFTKIHNSFGDQLHYDTRIPCNCSCCKTSKKPNSFTLKLIDTYIEKGQPTIQCNESTENVQVRRLRDGVIAPDRRDKLGHDEFMGYDRPEFGFDLPSPRPSKPTSPKSLKPKAKPLAQPIVIENHNYFQPTNQQDQTMTNDKIWNGDKVETKQEGKYVVNNPTQSMIGEQTIQGDNIQGNKIVNSQNLTEAAQDIKALLDQISATDTTNNSTLVALKAIEQIENNPTLKTRILNAGKEAGFAALDAAVDHPAIKIVTAAIKGAIDA